MHSLLGGALSLLLVFRTNSAYNRYWEARKTWESVLNRCRDLARFTHLYREPVGEPRSQRIASLLCAFPAQLRAHLTGEGADFYSDPGASSRISRHSGGGGVAQLTASTRASWALWTRPTLPTRVMASLERTSNTPIFIVKHLVHELGNVPDTARFTSRERLAAISMANQLSSYVGACERLLQTPVPLNYARHTSRFLTLWCLSLPISLLDSMGLLVVPVTAFVSWCLFGIQEIGLYIEHCALDDGSIFMDAISEQIVGDVLEAMEEV